MIRFIQEKDIDDVLNLGKKLHKESPIFNVYKWNEEKARKFIIDIIYDDNQCGILAFDDNLDLSGMILGYIDSFYFSKEISLQEHFIYIEKEKRGTKMVFKLLKEWVEWGKSKNAIDVWLKSTTGINRDKTSKLFNKLGFSEIGQTYRRR
tara:strand:- start:2027 stop:2476 length:450 start_codon:yes stop_codon:yes gene_type:complete